MDAQPHLNTAETVDLGTQGDIPSSVREAGSLLELGEMLGKATRASEKDHWAISGYFELAGRWGLQPEL